MSKIMSEYTDEDILYEYETVGDLIENKSLKTWWNTLNIDIRTPIKRLREAVTSLSTLARANNKNIANKTRMIQTKFKKLYKSICGFCELEADVFISIFKILSI